MTTPTLSPHFTLAEFTLSQTATRMGVDNTPHPATLQALRITAAGLEHVRTLLGGRAIIISSGYRSPALNTLVRGSTRSQHVLGEAVDFTCPSFGTPQDIIRELVRSDIAYDQVICEFFDPVKNTGWVHISFGPRNRREALVIDRSGTRPWE